MELYIPINPVPASRPRVSRFATYYPKQYTKFRKEMDAWIAKSKREVVTGNVFVSCKFHIEIPKSLSKTKKDALEGTFCDKKYDIDNLEKAVYDKLSGVFIEDDRYIVSNQNVKLWSMIPHIEVTIKKL